MIVGFVLWFVVLGLFTKGGRGWCNFLCPAGALQGLTHSLGRWLRLGRSVQIQQSQCRGCKTCLSVCPTWAISEKEDTMEINSHACNVCMDCTKVCSRNAIAYRPNKGPVRQTSPETAQVN